LLLFAHAPLSDPRSVDEAQDRITEASGFLRTFEPGLLFHEEWENLLIAAIRQRGGVPAPTTVLSADEPDLSEIRIAEIEHASELLAQLDEVTRARINLALRWFNGAVVSSGAAREEQFLRMWFALETLAMPGTNVRPINEALAAAYGVTLQRATAEFFIGRLVGLRSRIVHGEARLAPGAQLTDYLSAVFTDVFRQFLGLSCERRAAIALGDPELERAVRLAVGS
jgi:hypothetical protein